MTRPILCASLVVMMGVAVTEAGVPDPTRSGCSFPATAILPCPDPITMRVTLRDAFDVPVVNCLTDARILVDAGMLEAGQVMTVSGISSPTGIVDLTFVDGIRGNATIHFEIHALCVGDIRMCESGLYTVQCGAIAVEGASWGRVKSLYQ